MSAMDIDPGWSDMDRPIRATLADGVVVLGVLVADDYYTMDDDELPVWSIYVDDERIAALEDAVAWEFADP